MAAVTSAPVTRPQDDSPLAAPGVPAADAPAGADAGDATVGWLLLAGAEVVSLEPELEQAARPAQHSATAASAIFGRTECPVAMVIMVFSWGLHW
jgi:hypothetical protein